ncbi:MAG: RIP metalloprotease RseP [Desulfomonilaceae bacterium]
MEYFFGFLILLGVLIFVHECGHFFVAKLADVKVLKFSLGFPPAMLTRKWGETEYILSWIPLGGYVKLLGEDPDSKEEIPPEDLPRAFTSKSLLARSAIILAGPLSNYILAGLLLCAGYVAGWPVLASDIGKVLDGSPAAHAGLKTGDKVVAIDGQSVWRWDDMRSIIEKSAGKDLVMTIEREGRAMDVHVTPSLSDQKDVFGDSVGRIGVAPSGQTVKLGFFASIYEGLRFTGYLTKLVLTTLAKVVRGDISAKALSGPITIVQASGESLKAGLFSFIFLLSYISINLAIINLLPVPILDGGHLLFFLIEAIIRKPVTGRVREVAVHAGLLFIVLLMVLVFYNDITRIVTRGWTLQP